MAQLEQLRRETELLNKATTEHSAETAKAIIKTSIADRMKLLNNAGATWLQDYRRSLEEWSERNKVRPS